MALRTDVNESQIGTLHAEARKLAASIDGVLSGLPVTDDLYTPLSGAKARVNDIVAFLKKAEARVVLARLERELAALQALIAAKQAETV
jgi:hypothetical protein